MARTDVLVIGAGVSGLTTAARLLDAGLIVRMLAADPPMETTSAAAGATWGPYLVTDPRVLEWSERSRAVLQEFAKDPASGVRLVTGMEASFELPEPPSWARGVRDFRPCRAGELPAEYRTGWWYTIPVVDMPRYLSYLLDRLGAGGATFEFGTRLDSFAVVADRADALVNCCGVGARELVPDTGVYPVRGQLVVVENPGIDAFFQDDAEGDGMTYIVPHGDRVILGGCAVAGSEDTRPDAATAAAIVERCAAREPTLRTARVLGHLVGLRPTRSQVRVERDEVDGTPLVHNYGHGGSGLTLSWGCADEVLRLLG